MASAPGTEVEELIMIKLNIDNLKTGEAAPLFMQYDDQYEAQPAYIKMNENGVVFTDWASGNTTPSNVFHGRTLQWEVPSNVNGAALANLLESKEVMDLLERVKEGHTVEWNNNNHVGTLSDDAESANEQLAAIFTDDLLTDEVLMSAGDHFQYVPFSELWKEDQSLSEAVELIESNVKAEFGLVKIDADLEDYLLRSAAEFVSNEESGLSQNHLDALVKDNLIDISEAAEYASEHIKSKSLTK